jgi:hypothetical protein
MPRPYTTTGPCEGRRFAAAALFRYNAPGKEIALLLPTIVRTLEPLAASRALHLVVGLYISGALLLLSPDDRLLIPFFLLQRGIVIVLLWSNIGLPLVKVSAAASIAVGLIYLVTLWTLYRKAGRAVARAARGARPLTSLPLRALAVALALLLTHGLVQRYAPSLLPPLVSWSVAWLLVEFCFAVLMAPTPLHSGLGVLAFADAGRILYALTRPDALVWGVWASFDVLVVLAAAHLRTVEIAAYRGAHSHRRVRRERRETMELPVGQGGTPSASPESPPVKEADQDAVAHQEPIDPSAISAVETEPSDQPGPDTGETP